MSNDIKRSSVSPIKKRLDNPVVMQSTESKKATKHGGSTGAGH